jgi:hypothetical protein
MDGKRKRNIKSIAPIKLGSFYFILALKQFLTNEKMGGYADVFFNLGTKVLFI